MGLTRQGHLSARCSAFIIAYDSTHGRQSHWIRSIKTPCSGSAAKHSSIITMHQQHRRHHHCRITRLVAFLLLLALAAATSAFVVVQPRRRLTPIPRRLVMRDASMVRDVAVGDRVRVVPGIVLDGRDYSGLVGVVASTWVKCEVDPHCCCAELGTEGPIRVDFTKAEQEDADAAARMGDRPTDYHFFSEAELELLKRAPAAAASAGVGGGSAS